MRVLVLSDEGRGLVVLSGSHVSFLPFFNHPNPIYGLSLVVVLIVFVGIERYILLGGMLLLLELSLVNHLPLIFVVFNDGGGGRWAVKVPVIIVIDALLLELPGNEHPVPPLLIALWRCALSFFLS